MTAKSVKSPKALVDVHVHLAALPDGGGAAGGARKVGRRAAGIRRRRRGQELRRRAVRGRSAHQADRGKEGSPFGPPERRLAALSIKLALRSADLPRITQSVPPQPWPDGRYRLKPII